MGVTTMIAVGLVFVTLTTTTFAFAPSSSVLKTSASFVTTPAALKHIKPVQHHQPQLVVAFPRLFATLEEDATKASSSSCDSSVAKSFDESDAVGIITKSKKDTSTLLGEPIPYSKLTIGVLKELYPGENRVSQTPDSIRTLTKAGMMVVVEKGGMYILRMYSV
jgi:hypothetical protein